MRGDDDTWHGWMEDAIRKDRTRRRTTEGFFGERGGGRAADASAVVGASRPLATMSRAWKMASDATRMSRPSEAPPVGDRRAGSLKVRRRVTCGDVGALSGVTREGRGRRGRWKTAERTASPKKASPIPDS